MSDDLDNKEEVNSLAAAQRNVLESIALERPLAEVLEKIIALAESQFPDVVCAVLVVDALGALRYVVAPSLPNSLLSQSSRAQRFADTHAVSTGVDHLRDAYHALLDSLDSPQGSEGLHACWRKLLYRPDGSVIGAFEVFCKEPRELSPGEAECLERFMRLVHVTIANDHARRSEHLRAIILDSVEDAIFFVEAQGDRDHRFISVNKSFTRMFGVAVHEMAGKLLREVLPQERQDAIFARYKRACDSKMPQHWEEAMQARTGERHGEITIVPIFDQADHCTHFVGAVHDVTARVLAERDRAHLHQKLNQAQRMQALGTLAGGIAHDFNNILAAIGGNAKLLLEDIASESPLYKRVQEIDKASRRAVDLVRQILTFSRNATPSYRVFDPRTVTEEALNLLRPTLPNVRIVTDFAADVPSIKADATQFHQILINLITNAARASENSSSPIEVALCGVTSEEVPTASRSEAGPARFLLLRISDRGVGMDAATLKRAFEPFFTTRPLGEGTGLGLAVVHGIVASHGGHIDIQSTRAHGTEVRVYLPAIEARAEPEPTSLARGHGHDERVMYVDDEEGLVELMELALSKLGYRFFGFTDPVAALDAFSANPSGIDVVITDIAMPQMSGTLLAKRMRAIRPDIPIVMISGYIRPEDRQVAERLRIDQLIYKSNTIDELAAALAIEIERLKKKRH